MGSNPTSGTPETARTYVDGTRVLFSWDPDQSDTNLTVTRRGKQRTDDAPLTPAEAHCHFKRTLRDSQWKRLKGFHVRRHSFASNLATAGVDQRVIDEWMGNQTEEMRKRYRHLFPDQQQKVIDSVFAENGK